MSVTGFRRVRGIGLRGAVAVAAALALLAGLPARGPLPGVTKAAAAGCPCTIWPATATPTAAADPDGSAVEVGVKFRSDVDGYVTGVRFYKGTGNTGTHVGHLWSRAGDPLAAATFTGETAIGWQQVLFAAPVPISAGLTYVASYYAPTGHYAADTGFFGSTGVDNSPLHALADGVDGANGSYRYGTGGGFPTNTWQSANYWVDVVFDTTAADTTPPAVTSTGPAAGTTGVPTGTAVSAAFSEPVQPATIGFTLRNPAGSTVPASQSYDPASQSATLTPAAPLAPSTVYTATVSGAADLAGNPLPAQFTWSFTTGGAAACPCSIWAASATPAVVNVADASAVELGVKFRSSTAGTIRGIRFYKGNQNTGIHTGTLWSRTGTSLATVTFTGETGSGWQQALFSAAVPVSANTTYVASYHTNTGFYSATANGFAGAVSSGPLTALANGTDGGNGVYRYGAGFPIDTFQATNYWVDVVFDLPSPDTVPPTVAGQTPAPGTIGVPTSSTVSVTFSEDIQPSTVDLRLTGPGGAAVAGSVGYAAGSRTATFTPTADLATSTTYTASVSGATDLAGNPMAGPVSWSFTTAAPPPPPPTQGPGGPVLVIGNTAAATSQFSLYTAEILRAEGLNEFATADLAAVTASTLAGYDVVILGATPLTAAQVTMFTSWVTGGGRLVAFRPDPQLAGLLGLAPAGSTLAEAYLKVNTTAAPGTGITDQTIQFHGTADRYTLAGATAVATLYSNASTATTSPAVSLRSVGGSGGRAAAFSYDLPRSIVYTRQGNPAWAGQDRDGQPPIRSDDLYFGGAATDWVNLGKVAIPQADEQQRLLANLIGLLALDRKPLPRFWYFPRSGKAVVVATGDDHGNGGTAGRFDQYLANSPAGCSVDQWTCPRFGSYLYPSTPFTDAQAQSYGASGFEIGLHPQNGCANFNPTSLESSYATQLAQFAQRWPSQPSPTTSRYHCIVYSDWASQPKTERNHGIRLDTNYYYWPGSWINDRPGFMTGSGIPMRFADTDGTFVDVYQAATQLTDESGQSYPATPNTLLDNALGPLGYYGAFTANVHTDAATTFPSDQLLASALARGVPVISGRQLLSWVDGRNGSSFRDIGWTGSTLTFGVATGTGSNGLTGMVPTTAADGATLTALSRGGTAVPFTRTTVKGVEYAFFPAAAGDYTGTYSTTLAAPAGVRPGTRTPAPATTVDTVAPQPSTVATLPLPDGTASVTWTTAEAADSTVVYGTDPAMLDRAGYDPTRVAAHALVLTGLEPDRTYHYRVVSVDAAGNRTVWPAADRPAASFVSAAAGVADRSLTQLRMGTGSGTYLQQDAFGEVSLAPEDGQEFGAPVLPTTWQDAAEATGGTRRVSAGALWLDGQRAQLRRTVGPGRSLSFAAAFDGQSEQAVGWRSEGAGGPAAVIASRAGALFAATTVDGRTSWVPLPAGLAGSTHRYTIDWSATAVSYSVDGQQVTSQPFAATALRPAARDARADGLPLVLDWVRLSGYAPTGTLTSRVLDARAMVAWDRAYWQADVPAAGTLVVRVRTGSTPRPDATWTGWQALTGPGARVTGSSRYLQYQVVLSTRAADRSPTLRAIGFTASAGPRARPPGETGR